MASLREVFVNWQIKSNLAAEMKKLDDAIDETSDEFKDMANEAEKAAKKTADEWGKVGAKTRDIGKSIAAGIGIGITALVGAGVATAAFVTQWAQGAAQIDSTAKRIGISAQALQEWEYAAKASGGEAEGIAGIFRELNNRLTEVGETGTGSAADALTLLKLRVEDLRRLKPEQQMEAIADRLAMISDVGARTFIKDSLFGGEYEKIGSLLEQGSAGILALRKEAQSLGGVLDGAALKGAKDFNRELAKTEATLTGVKSTIAQAFLPVFRDLVERFGDWVRNNRELIATRIEEWTKRLADWFEKIAPLVVTVVETTARLVDEIGGIEPALKIAAGGWVAWQLAGLAAINTVGAALAVFVASFVAGMALADRFNGGPANRAKNARDAKELSRFKQATDLATANTADSGDPAVERAKRLLTAELESLRQMQGSGTGATRSKRLQAAIDEQYAAIDRAREGLTSAIAESDAALTVLPDDVQGMRLGRIAKPGGEKPLTTEALLKEQRKREAELAKLRQIRSDLESRRMNAQGTERMTIERTLADVNKRITGTDVKGVNELIAEAVGQGTGLGSGALRPAGLGTSINQIDASITINVGGLDIEVPSSAIDPGNPRASAQSFADIISAKLSEVFGQAARLQVAQING